MKRKDAYFLFLREEGDAKQKSASLLREALSAYEKAGGQKEAVLYAPSGKPYFPSGKRHLSVTHTGALYAAVFAPFPVGIDAEKKKETRPLVAKRFFSPEERLLPFSLVWTAKEAVAKLDGRGLSVMGKIRAEENKAHLEGKTYALIRKETNGYLITIAREENEN